MSSASSGTVRFDVGGTVYEVSRSLLERHSNTMLTHMASDTWQEDDFDPDTPLFIERDGERFKYVLDYMRDGRVSLPAKQVAKDALLADLEYFGFVDIPEDAIRVACSTFDSVQHLLDLERQYKTKTNENAHFKMCLDLAHHIFTTFKQNGNASIRISSGNPQSWSQSILSGDLNVFSECLCRKCD